MRLVVVFVDTNFNCFFDCGSKYRYGFQINFAHLHPVAVTEPYAFFVHDCKPLPEPPKPVVAPNDKLPQLVAEMVQKGLNSTPKAAKILGSTTTTTVNVTTTTATAQICKSVGSTATVASSTSQLQNSLRVLQMQSQQQLQKVIKNRRWRTLKNNLFTKHLFASV